MVSLLLLCGCLLGLVRLLNCLLGEKVKAVISQYVNQDLPHPYLVKMAARLGEITSQYRWFSLLYLLLVFFIFPAVIFALSLAGTVAFFVVLSPVALALILVLTLSIIQNQKPSILPERLRTWNFLPEPLRSLEPLDRIIRKLNCLKLCRKSPEMSETELNTVAIGQCNNNSAYQHDTV